MKITPQDESVDSESALYGNSIENNEVNEKTKKEKTEKVNIYKNKLKSVGVIDIGFDAYLKDIPDDIMNLKFSETVRATIVSYPKTFNEIVYTMSHDHGLDAFIMEECLVKYGLNRLLYDEISSFGLEKKVDIFKRIKRHVQLPSSETNKLEIYRDNCSVCRKKISLSEKSMSLIMHTGTVLDMGTSDVLMLCILISLNESAFTNKEFYWFKKDFGLEREKKGFKVIKEKNLVLRSKIKVCSEKIDIIFESLLYKDTQNNITDDEKRQLLDIKLIKKDLRGMRLKG